MSPVERDRSIRVRCSAEEHEMLHKLAEDAGVSASDLLRLYVRRAYALAHGEAGSFAGAIALREVRRHDKMLDPFVPDAKRSAKKKTKSPKKER